MTSSSSYFLSPTRTSTPHPLLFNNPLIHLRKHPSSSLSPAEFRRPSSNSQTPLSLSSLSLLPLRGNGPSRPLAALSSFAEADDGGRDGVAGDQPPPPPKEEEQQHREGVKSEEVRGMAEAFNVSSRTASAVTVCIAAAALILPLFMSSLGQGMPLKTRALSYATLLFGFYMAWNIGANDVANAMGTSVGSGAISLRQAVLLAAVLEFSGALLMGTHVTSTMQKGILVANVFQGKDTLLFAGLLSSLAAAGTWLQVSRFLEILTSF